MPGAGEDGGDFDMDLAGTWALDNTSVRFDYAADTFLRDMTFSYSSNRLSGEATFSRVTINVVLREQ